MYAVVITKLGFMTTKKLEEVLDTDKILFKDKDEDKCNNVIHGKK